MAEPSLGAQEILDGQFLLWLIAQNPFSVHHLIQGPVTGVHRRPADLHKLRSFIPPSPGAGGENVQESSARRIDGLFRLGVEILEVIGKSGLGRIGDMVLGHNGRQVLPGLHLAVGSPPHRRGGGIREPGSGG